MNPHQPFIFNIRQDEIDTLKHLQKLLNNHKFLQVIQEGRKARNKYPRIFFFYTIPSIAYSLTNRLEDAFQLLKEAEQNFPDSSEVMYQLAKIHEDIMEYDEAEKYYKKSYEGTPADHNDARSECLNDLGALYWKMHRKDEALESWKLALMEDPKNIMAQNNLRDFTNEYGEPSAVAPIMDDMFHFQNIQMVRYFHSKNLTEFQSMEEADKIMRLISDAWNRNIVPEKKKLDSSIAYEKTKWFESIEINFDDEPMTDEEKSKLFKSSHHKTSDKLLSKKKKKYQPLGKKILSKEEIEIEELRQKFPYLPDNGLFAVTIAYPFLMFAGMNIKRYKKILLKGTDEEEEQDMLLWAYDIGITLFESFFEEDGEDAEDLVNEALEIAAEHLDGDEIEKAFEITMKAIQDLGKELE